MHESREQLSLVFMPPSGVPPADGRQEGLRLAYGEANPGKEGEPVVVVLFPGFAAVCECGAEIVQAL